MFINFEPNVEGRKTIVAVPNGAVALEIHANLIAQVGTPGKENVTHVELRVGMGDMATWTRHLHVGDTQSHALEQPASYNRHHLISMCVTDYVVAGDMVTIELLTSEDTVIIGSYGMILFT